MPPRSQQSLGPTLASSREPGIRVCPHTCPNPDNLCDRMHVYARAGNSCRRHTRSEGIHNHCTEACPAHKSHGDKERVLERRPTYSEWMAINAEDRAWYKERYRAETPSTDGSNKGEDEKEDDVSILLIFLPFTLILSVAVGR